MEQLVVNSRRIEDLIDSLQKDELLHAGVYFESNGTDLEIRADVPLSSVKRLKKQFSDCKDYALEIKLPLALLKRTGTHYRVFFVPLDGYNQVDKECIVLRAERLKTILDLVYWLKKSAINGYKKLAETVL